MKFIKILLKVKSLRATSYIEALTAQILKRYYPFPNQTKNSMEVRHIQGKSYFKYQKAFKSKNKSKKYKCSSCNRCDFNRTYTNKSWFQKLSNTFRENMGVIDDIARENIKTIPLIEGIEPKELIEMIEDNYNFYREDSIFYKDILEKQSCKLLGI